MVVPSQGMVPLVALCDAKTFTGPLHVVLTDGNNLGAKVKQVELFLEKSPNCASIPCREGKLPLHYASVRHASTPVIEKVYRAYPKALMAQDNQGNTPIHLSRYVPDALLYVQNCPDVCKVTNEVDELPLHTLLRMRPLEDPSLIAAVLEAFPEGIRRANKKGELPLHVFLQKWIRNKDMAVLNLLLDTFPAAVSHADHTGGLPIHHFVQRGSGGDEILDKLTSLSPTCATKTTKSGNSILHLAFYPMPIKWIVANYPKLCEIHNKEGDLPLHTIVCNNKYGSNRIVKAIEDMIEAFPDSVRTTNHKRQLPIHKAAPSQVHRVPQLLIDKYPEGLFAADDDGRLPIQCFLGEDISGGVSRGQKVKALNLVHDPYPQGLANVDNHGNNALHLANDDDRINWVLEKAKDVKSLCKAQNQNGEYPVHLIDYATVKTETLDKLAKLLPEGCWSHPDRAKGNTPLHNASLANYTTVRWLLRRAPKAAAHLNHRGRLPWHILAQYKFLKYNPQRNGTWKIFKETVLDEATKVHPAILTTYDHDGFLPVHYACQSGAGLKRQMWPMETWLTEEHKSTLPCTRDGTPLVFLACQPESTDELDALTRIYTLLHRSLDVFG